MDTPAFQHLLSLFPLLTLCQRRVAQQELTAPHHYLTQYSVTGMQWLPTLSGRCYPAGAFGMESGTAPLPLQTVSAHQIHPYQNTPGPVAQKPSAGKTTRKPSSKD